MKEETEQLESQNVIIVVLRGRRSNRKWKIDAKNIQKEVGFFPRECHGSSCCGGAKQVLHVVVLCSCALGNRLAVRFSYKTTVVSGSARIIRMRGICKRIFHCRYKSPAQISSLLLLLLLAFLFAMCLPCKHPHKKCQTISATPTDNVFLLSSRRPAFPLRVNSGLSAWRCELCSRLAPRKWFLARLNHFNRITVGGCKESILGWPSSVFHVLVNLSWKHIFFLPLFVSSQKAWNSSNFHSTFFQATGSWVYVVPAAARIVQLKFSLSPTSWWHYEDW